jgi:peptidoglycan/xylan/chitin deacetylase (PgdA/CDA1 family)
VNGKWKDGKQWVYSITYDEGCEDLLKYALGAHREFGIPGHVALVATQIGVPRDCPGSSYNGLMILSKEQIQMLCAEGWGVSCHSMTHVGIDASNAEHEVVESRKVLEDALEMPVTMFCVPGTNDSYPASHAVAEQAGYNSILTIYDDVNTADTDLLRLHRCPVHKEYPPPFYSAFDPYKRIHQAIDAGGWIIDYCHCPTPGEPIHPWKDCTLEQLHKRFETVCRVGGSDVWLAEPTAVVEYLLDQRNDKR